MCQLDWTSAAENPADLSCTDIGANDRNRSENQDVGQVHVTDAFLFATYFLPFLIGMGEEPPHMMDHLSNLLVLIQAAPQRSAGDA
ncbi:hypothetical protein D3C80_1433740 [compost metagenome]